jgi:hypothetical protein
MNHVLVLKKLIVNNDGKAELMNYSNLDEGAEWRIKILYISQILL